MKRILTAFYPSVTPVHVITFAIQFAKQNSAVIHAVYLSEEKEIINSDYPFPNDLSITEDFGSTENISQENNKLIEDNIKVFKKECELNGITFSIEKNITVEQLIDKTANSDLLITDSESNYIERVLTKMHCPAFITSTAEMPKKVILMYDNSLACKRAIETYISLFPQFANLPTCLFSINTEPQDKLEMKQYFEEKLQPVFSNLNLQIEYGNTKKEFKNFIDQLSGPALAVMGAFGRSALSNFFYPSLANTALKERNISLFIVHDN
jgi:hypothetical protein